MTVTPTVTALLRSASATRVAEALTMRPDLATPPPASIAELAQRAVRAASVRMALEGVDRWRWQVLEALSVCDPPASTAMVASLLRTADGAQPDADDVEEALASLADWLLVFVDADGAWWPNPGLGDVIARSLGLGPPVRSLLGSLTADELRGIAVQLGGAGGAKRKAELLELVGHRLRDPEVVAGVILSAPAKVRDLLGAAGSPYVQLPYNSSYFRVAAYGRGSTTDPYRWLMTRGLLFASSWSGGLIPREVGLALRGGVVGTDAQPRPPLIPTAEIQPEAIDKTGAARAAAAVRTVARLLEELASRPAQPLKSGGLGAREVKRLAKALDVDGADLRLTLELARVAGLVPGAWQPVAPTAAADDWSRSEPARQWLALARAWLADEGAPLSVNGTKDPERRAIPNCVDVNGLPARALRLAVLGVSADLGPARAAAGPLHDAVRWRAPASHAELAPDLARQVTDWLVAEAEGIGLLASGSLTSVGRALLVGDLDRAALLADQLVRPAPATVFVQADHTIVVDAGAPAGLLAQLRTLADVESTGAALVLRISPVSVRRALDSGYSADELLALLTEHAPSEVPQPVTYLIEDTARRWGQLRTGHAVSYVRSDDPAVLAEAAAHRKLAKIRLRLLAPTVAVSDQPHDAILAALREAGFLPAAEGADGTIVRSAPVRHRSPAGAPMSKAPTRRPSAGRPDLSAEERRQLAAQLLEAPDPPTASRPAREPAGSPPRPSPGSGDGALSLFDPLGHDVGAEHIAGQRFLDALESVFADGPDGLDHLDEVDEFDEVEEELIELIDAAQVDGAPVELVRAQTDGLRSLTGRVLLFDVDELVALVVQEPGGAEIMVDLADVVAYRSLDLS
jgi:hypothetical protein